VELISISTDETPPPPRSQPPIAASGEDLDAAFGAISGEPSSQARKLPSRVPLFTELSDEAFVSFVTKLGHKHWMPGEMILTEGQPGRSFFVIVEGKVVVFKRMGNQSIELAQLGEGAFFGEMALLSGTPRTANVAAVDETELLEVTDTALRELVEDHPSVAESLKSFYRQRLLNNVMTISPLFKDFDPNERKSIAERFKMRQAPAGTVLITEGTNSDGLYVVLHGQVRVNKKNDEGKEVGLALLKEGDLFGEMSLLTHKKATATVTAAVNSILLKLPREGFQELILTHPQILELISTLTEQRKSATELVLSGQGPGIDGMSFV
jgi:CRP-like cAMP-binding protein